MKTQNSQPADYATSANAVARQDASRGGGRSFDNNIERPFDNNTGSRLDGCPPADNKEETVVLVADGVGEELGGAPSEGVDVASSSFPSVKNQGLIELVGP